MPQGKAPTPDKTQANAQKLRQLLEERLNVRGQWPDDVITPEGIRVPLPPMFRKHTPVVGTDLEHRVEDLYKIAPELRGRAKLISEPYTPTMISYLMDLAGDWPMKGKEPKSEMDYVKQGNSNVARTLLSEPQAASIIGMTNADDGDIYVSDWFGGNKAFGTLAHEFQHLVDSNKKVYGNTSEAEAQKTGEIAKDYSTIARKESK